MRFLLPSEVVQFYIEISNDQDPVVDFHALEEAVLRPQEGVLGYDLYPSIHDKAAALFESLIRLAPFQQRNGAVAVVATYVYYRMNGCTLEIDEDDLLQLAEFVRVGEAGASATIAAKFGLNCTRD